VRRSIGCRPSPERPGLPELHAAQRGRLVPPTTSLRAAAGGASARRAVRHAAGLHVDCALAWGVLCRGPEAGRFPSSAAPRPRLNPPPVRASVTGTDPCGWVIAQVLGTLCTADATMLTCMRGRQSIGTPDAAEAVASTKTCLWTPYRAHCRPNEL
jgi:hypothetical protein